MTDNLVVVQAVLLLTLSISCAGLSDAHNLTAVRSVYSSTSNTTTDNLIQYNRAAEPHRAGAGGGSGAGGGAACGAGPRGLLVHDPSQNGVVLNDRTDLRTHDGSVV